MDEKACAQLLSARHAALITAAAGVGTGAHWALIWTAGEMQAAVWRVGLHNNPPQAVVQLVVRCLALHALLQRLAAAVGEAVLLAVVLQARLHAALAWGEQVQRGGAVGC